MNVLILLLGTITAAVAIPWARRMDAAEAEAITADAAEDEWLGL